MENTKTLTVILTESQYAELKFCAKNLNVTPSTIMQKFISDLLSDKKTLAQTWFWQNRNDFIRG